MRNIRTYELSKFDGERIALSDLRKKPKRKALVGKRIGYDLRGSFMAHKGTITGEGNRYEIEIDGNMRSIAGLEQVVVLREQGETK